MAVLQHARRPLGLDRGLDGEVAIGNAGAALDVASDVRVRSRIPDKVGVNLSVFGGTEAW